MRVFFDTKNFVLLIYEKKSEFIFGPLLKF